MCVLTARHLLTLFAGSSSRPKDVHKFKRKAAAAQKLSGGGEVQHGDEGQSEEEEEDNRPGEQHQLETPAEGRQPDQAAAPDQHAGDAQQAAVASKPRTNPRVNPTAIRRAAMAQLYPARLHAPKVSPVATYVLSMHTAPLPGQSPYTDLGSKPFQTSLQRYDMMVKEVSAWPVVQHTQAGRLPLNTFKCMSAFNSCLCSGMRQAGMRQAGTYVPSKWRWHVCEQG